ncbi:MAG: protein kinase [Oscillospiraceae bacterium]|nr:protein kinase [Oscillospiraceae bacterium]
MLDHKVSPLLDAMEVGECFSRHDGVSCYRILHPESGREFVLKHISVPAREEQVEALLLTGAYSSAAEADAYYRKEAEALVREAENRKKLLDCPYILPFLGVQMEKKEDFGYDVYAVLPKRNSLQSYLNENAVSHLRGINMGIDLCVALAALREEGYVHGNLKPGNVFFSDTGRFLLGDFGLISTEDMQYAVLPEQYRSSYTAPELNSFVGGMNPTVDIYSLGMILYRIYNGNHAPFEDEKTSPKAADAKRVSGEPLPVPIYADYELTEIILKASAFDPAERYQTPEEMRIELEQYMRRNAVSDHLIVPPLVTDGAALSSEAAQEQPEPVRFTDPDKLDEGFKKTFSPEESKEQKADKEKKEKKSKKEEPPKLNEELEKNKKKHRRRAWILFAAALALVILLVGVYEFTDLGKGMWHYFVTVDKLELSDVTADSLRLRIDTNTDPDAFIPYCQDPYGNSFTGRFQSGVAEFSGLKPNTQYNLKVELPGLHKLSGVTTASAATKARTELLAFSAEPGSAPGSVKLLLTLKDSDTEPAFWTLRYGKEGETPAEMQFAGRSCQINDLENGAPYRFELVETDNLYLSGVTSLSYTPLIPIEASELQLDSIQDGTALLRWRCASELPEAWELVCTGPEGESLPVELRDAEQDEAGWICSAAVSGIVPDISYTVKLDALGLPAPLKLELKDDQISIQSFTAEALLNGLSLHWSANREPEAGWKVVAAFGDGQRIEELFHGDSGLLAVLPDTDYTVTIEPADGSDAKGERSLSVRSWETVRYTQRGLDQHTTIGTYFTPDKEEWSFVDLGGGTVRYRHNDKITFVITASRNPDPSEEEVTVQYVIRNTDTGAVVDLQQEKLVWDTLWDGNRWFGQIPWLPNVPGAYSFSIYLDSQRLGTIPFTLIE